MESQIGSGTAKGLAEFLDQLVEKGRATSGSVTPLKTAVKQVLSAVDGANWQTTDVRSIDVSDYLVRFGNKTMGKYNADSLRTYKSRVNKAVNWYKHFLSQPGWIPPRPTQPQSSKPKPLDRADNSQQEADNEQERRVEPQRELPDKIQSDLIAYPFPLRPGKIVSLYLPLDLTFTEAKRLGKYLESLSMDADTTTERKDSGKPVA
jgi:hypothetical protein